MSSMFATHLTPIVLSFGLATQKADYHCAPRTRSPADDRRLPLGLMPPPMLPALDASL